MIKTISGAGYLLRGVALLPKKGIFPYVVVPMIINALLFGLALILAIGQIGGLIDWTLQQLPGWLQWLDWLMWPLLLLSAFILVFFLVAILANIIAAPFNTLLAEAVERHLTGKTHPTEGVNWYSALKEAPKAIGSEFIKIGYFAKFAIPLGILFLIPGLNLFAPALWFIFSAWMLALEYCDYHLGNHCINFSQQRTLLGKERMLTLGFGAASTLATITPIINLIAMPASVAGSTAMLVEKGVLDNVTSSTTDRDG